MYPVLIQERGPFFVYFLLLSSVVNPTIHLYAQTQLRTIEIQHISPVSMLLPETISIQLLLPQMFP